MSLLRPARAIATLITLSILSAALASGPASASCPGGGAGSSAYLNDLMTDCAGNGSALGYNVNCFLDENCECDCIATEIDNWNMGFEPNECLESPGLCTLGETTSQWCKLSCFAMTEAECAAQDMYWMDADHVAGDECCTYDARVASCVDATDPGDCTGEHQWRVWPTDNFCCTLRTQAEAEVWMHDHDPENLEGYECTFGCQSFKPGIKFRAPLDCELSTDMTCGSAERVNHARGEFMLDEIDFMTEGTVPSLPITMSRSYRGHPDMAFEPGDFAPAGFTYYGGSDAFGEGWYFPFEVEAVMTHGATFVLRDGMGQVREFSIWRTCESINSWYQDCCTHCEWGDEWVHAGSSDTWDLVDPENCGFQLTLRDGSTLNFEATTCDLWRAPLPTDEDHTYPLTDYRGRLKEIVDQHGNKLVLHYRGPLDPIDPEPDPCDICPFEFETYDACHDWEGVHLACPECNATSCAGSPLEGDLAEYCDDWLASNAACPECPETCGACIACADGAAAGGVDADVLLDHVTDGNGTVVLSFTWARLPNLYRHCGDCWHDRIVQACRRDGKCWTYDYYTRPDETTWYEQEFNDLPADLGGGPGMLRSVTTPPVEGADPLDANSFPDGITRSYTYAFDPDEPGNSRALKTVTDGRSHVVVSNDYYWLDVPITGSYLLWDGDWSNHGCGDLPPILPGRLAKQIHGDPADVEPRVTHYYYAPVAVSESVPDFWIPGVPAQAPVLKSIVNDHGRVVEHGIDGSARDVQTRVFTGLADPTLVTTVLDNRPKSFQAPLRATDPEYFQTTKGNDPRGVRAYTRHPNGRETITWPVNMSRAPSRSKSEIRAIVEVAGPLDTDQAFLTTLFTYDFDDEDNTFTYNVVEKETRYASNSDDHFEPTSLFYDPPPGADSVLQVVRTHDRNLVTSEKVATCAGNLNCLHVSYLRDVEAEYDALGREEARVSSPFPTAASSLTRRRDERTYRTAAPGAGLLESVIVDADNGAATTLLEYDALGRVRREIDALAGDRLITYNTLGWKVREESPLIDNDGAGPLDAFRQRTDYVHDENGNVIRIEVENRDERGSLRENASLTTEITFDALNRPIRTVQEVDENLRITTEKDYNPFGQVIEERTGECVGGRDDYARTRFQYDERGLLYRKLEGVGPTSPTPQPSLVTQHDYDLNGNLARTTVGVGLSQPRVTEWRYDGYDRMVEETDPTGTRRVLHYDWNGAVISETAHGSDGAVSPTEVLLRDVTYVRDGLGRTTQTSTKAIDPETHDPITGGTVTTATEYSYEHATSSADGYGTGPSFLYDSAGRLAKTTDPFGNTVESEHDLLGRVIKETRRDISQVDQRVEVFEVVHGYDGLGRKKWTEDDLSNVTTFVHDSLGNEVAVTDTLGGGIATEHDGLGRVTATVRLARADRPQDTSIRTTQEWDDNSRLTAQLDDNGNRTEYSYYPLGHLRWTTFADDTQRETQRNAFGDLIEIVEPDNTHVASLFDRSGRVTYVAVGVGGATDPETTEELYRYDGLGRLVFAEDDDTVVERLHDSFGHVVKEVVNGLEVSTTYDTGGLPIVKKYPSGLLIHAEPDLTAATAPVARVGKLKHDDGFLIADFDYLGPGRVELVTFGNEVEGRRYFDTLGRLSRMRYTSWETALVDLGFTWDALGNRTSESNHVTGNVHTWTLDSFSRLVASSFGQPGGEQKTMSYELDGAQNRTSIHIGTNGYGYSMDSTEEPTGSADYQVNQYTTAAGEYFEHDLKGNLALRNSPTAPDYELTFDHRNRLAQYEDVADAKVTRHVIDALGRRVGTRHLDSNGSTIWSVAFALDGDRVIEEHDSESNVTSHVHGLGLDELVQTRRGTNTVWALTDDLLSVRALANDSGVLVERYEYADYGEPIIFDAEDDVLTASAHGNDRLFTGRPYDWSLRACDHRARWMDPRVGRFMSRDPIGSWGDPLQLGNGSAYAANNPRTLVDPTGTFTNFGPAVLLPFGERTPLGFGKALLDDAGALARRFNPVSATMDDFQTASTALYLAAVGVKHPDRIVAGVSDAAADHARALVTDDGELAGAYVARMAEVAATSGAGAPAAFEAIGPRLMAAMRNLGSASDDILRATARATSASAPSAEQGAALATREASRWSRTEFNNTTVYQRNDLIDPSRIDKRGRSNLQRMKDALAPIGPDGESINLHHVTQKADGPLAEVTATLHSRHSRVIHINSSTIPSGIDRNQFNAFKRAYWSNRASDFLP